MDLDNLNDDQYDEYEQACFEAAIEALKQEYEREKLLILNPSKVIELKENMKKILNLLKKNGFTYGVKIEKLDCFPKQVIINIIIENSFNVSAQDNDLFKDVINFIDGISISNLNDNNIEILMTVKDIFIEIKE